MTTRPQALHPTIFIAGLCWLVCAAPAVADATAPLFDTTDTGAPPGDVPVILPWRTVALDPDFGYQWVVAGDVDDDGEVEIVSAENVNAGDVHYTSTTVAQNLNGSMLWRWGDPKPGRKIWHHDVACQIQDWNADGRYDVVLCTKPQRRSGRGRTPRAFCKRAGTELGPSHWSDGSSEDYASSQLTDFERTPC